MLEELKNAIEHARAWKQRWPGATGSVQDNFLAKYGDVLIAAVERDGLAHEVAKAAGGCRKIQAQRNQDENEWCAGGLTYSFKSMTDAEKRLDALLAKYTEATNEND